MGEEVIQHQTHQVKKILHKPQVLLEDSNLSGGRLEAGSTTEMSLTFRNKSCSQNVFG